MNFSASLRSYCLVLICMYMFGKLFALEISTSSVQNFRNAIRSIRDEVMGASTFQTHINDVVNLERVQLDGKKITLQVAQGLSSTFMERQEALNRLSNAVKVSLSQPEGMKPIRKCCKLSDDQSRYDSRFHTVMDTNQKCSILAPTAPDVKKTPGQAFLDAAVENIQAHPGLKWQYFGSEEGVFTRFPSSPVGSCNTTYDNRYRPWYVQASATKPKDVVVVIDRSASMKDFGKMESAKNAAKTVLSTLTPNDRATVITFSNEAYALGSAKSARAVSSKYFVDNNYVEHKNTSCFRHTLATATPMNIHRLVEVVNLIVPYGETYYGKALTLAFDFLKEAYLRDIKDHESLSGHTVDEITRSRDRVILFLSDGEPTDSPRKIFNLIRDRNREMANSVVMLCFALGSGTFGAALKRMATQKFGWTPQDAIPAPTPGLFHHVVDVQHLRFAMGSYYNFFSKHRGSNEKQFHGMPVIWSVPYYDAGGIGMVLTVATPVAIDGKLRGVVGVDVTMHELFADITYFRVAAHTTYAFLVDTAGRVLMHPFLPAPAAVYDDPVITGIDAFERTDEVRRFIKRTLHSVELGLGPEGNPATSNDVFSGVFRTIRVLPVEHKAVNVHNATLTYSCASVGGTQFVLCIVVEANVTSVTNLGLQPIPTDFEFLYHRFDLVKPTKVCRHQNQVVTENRTSVTFAPSSFVDSGKYSELPETVDLINGYHQYMTTGKYANADAPRFRPGVRSSLLATWVLESIWLKLRRTPTSYTMQSMKDHVTWLYIGTEQGTMRIFPGSELPKLYNPVHRPWYELGHSLITDTFVKRLKQETTDTLHDAVLAAVSPPYLDANGQGLVITVSRGIVEPPPTGQTESKERPPHVFGVMGADIFLSYLENLLKETVAECNEKSQTCMVLDKSGFVIYDRRLSSHEPDAIAFASKTGYHVTHASSYVASTLIKKRILVRRKCIDLASVTHKVGHTIDLQRMRQVALSLPFSISEVAGTNVILLVVPLAYTSTSDAECRLHQSDYARCLETKAESCESPCMDMYGATEHYHACLNLYNHTWVGDPPPCFPDKYTSSRPASSNVDQLIVTKPDLTQSPLIVLDAIDPGTLLVCRHEIESGYILLPRTDHKPAVDVNSDDVVKVQFTAKKKFILYMVGVVMLLTSITVGLNRTRLKRLLCKKNSPDRKSVV
uniref:VWFA and cache domain-containing protein 1-like n=1 Tax=Phallusia mammillata TaxID=59560 RepID=A0A6F9D7Z6_9ASCI|nr:VWFA and cache domain-containing protein 1-like [Phallusia mammillata]